MDGRGFTLIELLLALTLVAALATASVPALRSFIRDCERTATVNALLQAIHTARRLAALSGCHVDLCPTRDGRTCSDDRAWDGDLLEELCEMLTDTAPKGQVLWNNKQMVPIYVPEQKDAWATVYTKKCDAVHLALCGPKGRFTLGQIRELGHDPKLDGERTDRDVVRLKFRNARDLASGDLQGFLKEHLAELKK